MVTSAIATRPRSSHSDADILEMCDQCHGVLPLMAARMALTLEVLSERISKSANLAYHLRTSAAVADGEATAAIREGCKAHNPVWVAMRMREREKEQERQSTRGTGGVEPIDFTREIAGPDECADEELLAVIRRDALERARPKPGEPCPCCGAVAPDVEETLEVIEP